MSWDCPRYNNKKCDLNGIECKPGKGNCVLRGKVEFAPTKKQENPNDKRKIKKAVHEHEQL